MSDIPDSTIYSFGNDGNPTEHIVLDFQEIMSSNKTIPTPN